MSPAVTRRSALTASAAVLAGAAGGFLYGRSSDARKAASTERGYQGYGSLPRGARKPIAPLAKVPVDGGLITDGVVLVRDGGSVQAFSATCTHLGCTVNRVAHGKIYCPCHGSVFDASTGDVIQGPAGKALAPVQVTVTNGEVYPA